MGQSYVGGSREKVFAFEGFGVPTRGGRSSISLSSGKKEKSLTKVIALGVRKRKCLITGSLWGRTLTREG